MSTFPVIWDCWALRALGVCGGLSKRPSPWWWHHGISTVIYGTITRLWRWNAVPSITHCRSQQLHCDRWHVMQPDTLLSCLSAFPPSKTQQTCFEGIVYILTGMMGSKGSPSWAGLNYKQECSAEKNPKTSQVKQISLCVTQVVYHRTRD